MIFAIIGLLSAFVLAFSIGFIFGNKDKIDEIKYTVDLCVDDLESVSRDIETFSTLAVRNKVMQVIQDLKDLKEEKDK